MTEIERDRWKRPLILPEDGGKPVAYTRTSTLAKALDDASNLTAWKQRKTAEGLLVRPDLLTRIAGVLANGDPDTDWPTKKELNRVCEQAMEAAGASKGSSAGTGFHAMTEAIDRGEALRFVPPADKPRLAAYVKAVRGAGLTALGMEEFVVNDVVESAGTFDRLWRLPDGRVVVGDLKTGKSEADYPLATAIQMAVYANGKRYDAETGERTPIHPDLDVTVGLLVHMPPSGGCTVIPLDLEVGWQAAQVAVAVRRIRKIKPAELKLAAA